MLASMKGSMRFKIIRSKMFENSGRRLMGLYDSLESGGLPGLGIIMIIENFQRTGKYDSLSIELKMCVKRSKVFWGVVYLPQLRLGHSLGFCDEGSFLSHIQRR